MGVARCSGKYFQLNSCDDVLLPQKIEKQVCLFDGLDENYACVYSDHQRINEYGEVIIKQTLFQERMETYDLQEMPRGNLIHYFLEVAFISAPTTLYRTKIIKDLKGFDEDFFIEDWPLYLKLSKHNYKFDYVDEVLVKYRFLHDSLSNASTWKIHLEILRICTKYHSLLIKNRSTTRKIKHYLLDVAKNSFVNFAIYYFRLFRFVPKDLRSNLKFLKAAILKK
jgi:hypothetical protein